MKASEYGTKTETSDQRESETATGKDVPPRVRSKSAERATKSASQKLCRSTLQKNPVMRFGNNKYIAHHYAYMTRVAKVR